MSKLFNLPCFIFFSVQNISMELHKIANSSFLSVNLEPGLTIITSCVTQDY